MRWTAFRRRNCLHLIRHGCAVPPSPHRGRLGGCAQSLAPLPGADSPYQGEMSRRDKRGRDAGSAKPRLRGCRRFAGKNPNRKFSLRFGKEETGSEEKRLREQRGLVPSRPVLTRLRRPYLFSRKRKDRGEKGRLDAFGAFCL